MSLEKVATGSLIAHRETGLVFRVEFVAEVLGRKLAKLAGENGRVDLVDRTWRPVRATPRNLALAG